MHEGGVPLDILLISDLAHIETQELIASGNTLALWTTMPGWVCGSSGITVCHIFPINDTPLGVILNRTYDIVSTASGQPTTCELTDTPSFRILRTILRYHVQEDSNDLED